MFLSLSCLDAACFLDIRWKNILSQIKNLHITFFLLFLIQEIIRGRKHLSICKNFISLTHNWTVLIMINDSSARYFVIYCYSKNILKRIERVEEWGNFVHDILLFLLKNNSIENRSASKFYWKGYHPMSCNPSRDCRVWDHTSSRLLLHRKMAGFQTVGRIPTVAYLASNGIHRASDGLANIKATLMPFRGNKAIWVKAIRLWINGIDSCHIAFYIKRRNCCSSFGEGKMENAWTRNYSHRVCLQIVDWETIYGKMIIKRTWIRLAIFSIDNLI